jgi:opacity protein-like surface antigen
MKIFGFDGAVRGPLVMLTMAFVLGVPAVSASAQALPTATKSIGLAVFGGGSYVKPDYGTTNDLGFILGGDISRSFRIVTVSIEPRFGMTSGDLVTQTYFFANLKLEHPFGRRDQFHPFLGGGAGTGKMHLGHPFPSDQTSTPSYDMVGGLDFDIKSNFGVKVEYQYQFWDFGYYSNGLSPNGADVAIYYRPSGFSFHRHR